MVELELGVIFETNPVPETIEANFSDFFLKKKPTEGFLYPRTVSIPNYSRNNVLIIFNTQIT